MHKDFQKWHKLKEQIHTYNEVILFREQVHGEDRTAILSQIRMLSAKRLIRRMSKISDKQFILLEHSLMRLIKETDPLRGPRVPNGNL